MFAKGRTELQAMIDYRAEILQRTLGEVPQLIERLFKEIENETSKVAQVEAGDDVDMKLSIQHSLDEMYRYYDKPFMLELINKALVVMTDSYCESTLKEITKVKKRKAKRGNTDIEKLLAQLPVKPKLNATNFVDEHWPDFVEFHNLRNNIVHEGKVKKGDELNIEYIAKNIESVRRLLRAVDALAFEN